MKRLLMLMAFASLALAAFTSTNRTTATSNISADHVRWDIISLNTSTTPPTFNSGGVASAFARNPSSLKIRLTGSGTFVAPASGGQSGAVTGGGTWETFSGCPAACISTGSGTYTVTRLTRWVFANSQIGS